MIGAAAATPTAGQYGVAACSFAVVSIGLAVLIVRVGRPAAIDPFDPNKPHHWELVDWERDRVLALAKSLGAAAIAFLSSVFAALLKNEISRSVPALWIWGAMLGIAGSLAVAMTLYLRAGNWARRYYNR